jgi:glycosyltransferase A (GT-A) superfamily protein (DUF2064 family)
VSSLDARAGGGRRPVALVVAKVPVAGKVKTRLAATVGPEPAARLAHAALLDTLDACESAFGAGRCHLALAGELDELEPEVGARLRQRLAGWSVLQQRGVGFGARLEHAHDDVHRLAAAPVVQIGMDTPHLDPAVLLEAGAHAIRGRPALGLAHDGGWWVLASAVAGDVAGLGQVAMSTPRTGSETLNRLRRINPATEVVASMRDIDDAADAELAAADAPHTRFASAWRDLDRRLAREG